MHVLSQLGSISSSVLSNNRVTIGTLIFKNVIVEKRGRNLFRPLFDFKDVSL